MKNKPTNVFNIEQQHRKTILSMYFNGHKQLINSFILQRVFEIFEKILYYKY